MRKHFTSYQKEKKEILFRKWEKERILIWYYQELIYDRVLLWNNLQRVSFLLSMQLESILQPSNQQHSTNWKQERHSKQNSNSNSNLNLNKTKTFGFFQISLIESLSCWVTSTSQTFWISKIDFAASELWNTNKSNHFNTLEMSKMKWFCCTHSVEISVILFLDT